MVMYKIDRRGGRGWGGVQKSYTRTDPVFYSVLVPILNYVEKNLLALSRIPTP